MPMNDQKSIAYLYSVRIPLAYVSHVFRFIQVDLESLKTTRSSFCKSPFRFSADRKTSEDHVSPFIRSIKPGWKTGRITPLGGFVGLDAAEGAGFVPERGRGRDAAKCDACKKRGCRSSTERLGGPPKEKRSVPSGWTRVDFLHSVSRNNNGDMFLKTPNLALTLAKGKTSRPVCK